MPWAWNLHTAREQQTGKGSKQHVAFVRAKSHLAGMLYLGCKSARTLVLLTEGDL
jgi:hypothetical protein